MKKLLGILLLMISTATFADDLIVNLASRHIGSSIEYNERNYGLGYAWKTNWKWTGEVEPQLGIFDNSEDRLVAYGLVAKYLTKAENNHAVIRLGVVGGGAIGYKNAPIMPIGGAVVDLRSKDLRGVGVNVLLSVYRDEREQTFKPLVGLQVVVPIDTIRGGR